MEQTGQFDVPTSDPNREMRQKIESRVIGKRIKAFNVTAHTVSILVEGMSKIVLEFEDVVCFELKTGAWKFVPREPGPGRPKNYATCRDCGGPMAGQPVLDGSHRHTFDCIAYLKSRVAELESPALPPQADQPKEKSLPV
jgi:hypothetical protein